MRKCEGVSKGGRDLEQPRAPVPFVQSTTSNAAVCPVDIAHPSMCNDFARSTFLVEVIALPATALLPWQSAFPCLIRAPPPRFPMWQLHATSGSDWATIKAHQDMVRKQRTRDRAAFLAATSSLPARMARHAAMQAVGLDRVGRKRGNSGSGPRDREEGVQGAASTRIEEPQNIGKIMHRRQER